MPTNLAAQLFDIDGLLLTKVESDYNTVTLHVEMERQEQPCPECGVLTDTVHDYRQQKVKEVSILGKDTTLILRKRRYVCKSCCNSFPSGAASVSAMVCRGSIFLAIWSQNA